MIKRIKNIFWIQTSYGKYRAVFDRDGGGYTVTAPDLDGVVTWGKNLAHAKKMAKEAIELCVECCVEQGVQKGFSRGQLGVVRV